jgi:hypothetical protein
VWNSDSCFQFSFDLGRGQVIKGLWS